MRVVIKDGLGEYRGVYLMLQDWFAKKEGITGKTADVLRVSEKAILLDFGDKQKWVPKSLFTVHEIPKGLTAWQ